jgi:hypothetical protein
MLDASPALNSTVRRSKRYRLVDASASRNRDRIRATPLIGARRKGLV